MSIRDNIAYGILLARDLNPSEVDEQVHAALTRVALWDEVKDRLAKVATELSGGQMQRLCIARVLAMRPEVLLLDEPTGALDPVSMAKIELLIDQLRRDITIVIVTHNMEQAARCSDQVAFMYLGQLIECGSAKQIFGAPANVKTQRFIAGEFS